MQTFGRTTIFSEFTEDQLLSGTIAEQAENIRKILINAIPIHNSNKEH